VLEVSKQTLSRHIKRLAEIGLIAQESSAQDRRKRPLRLTAEAADLVGRINAMQKRRLHLAFKSAGAAAVEGFERVLFDLVGEPRRELLRRPTVATRTP